MPKTTERPWDCLSAGLIVADFVTTPISHLPASGQLVLTDRIDFAIGGCAANVATDLAKLDRKVALVGRVGNDLPGHGVCERLKGAGVDVGWASVLTDVATSSTLIVNVAGEDRRFIHALGANQRFDAAELTDEILASTRVLAIGGYCLMDDLTAKRVADLFRRARRQGVLTTLDVVLPGAGDYEKALRPVLPETDVFLPNSDEAAHICGTNDVHRQVQTFLDWGVRTAVVTCGGAGTVAGTSDGLIEVPAFQTEFVDGTGSGDAFVAGFIDGWLDGASLRNCLVRGSALGASCVRATGATVGVFRRDELQAFLIEHAPTALAEPA